MSLLKQKRKLAIERVVNKSPEDRAISARQRIMRRMSVAKPRTHTGAFHLERNDPCLCGNVYAGVFLRDKQGNKILDPRNFDSSQVFGGSRYLEKPVKFKSCCLPRSRRRADEDFNNKR